MPYIDQEDRKKYDTQVDQLVKALKDSRLRGRWHAKDLNYIISSLMWKLWGTKPNYSTVNDLIGALECAKIEFYRRRVVTYESGALGRNGDLETESGGGG